MAVNETSPEEDLYDDLDGTTLRLNKKLKNDNRLQESFSSLSSNAQIKPNGQSKTTTPFLSPEMIRSKAEQELEKTTKLEKQVEKLTKENETIRRNISILYRTAKTELARKDREIEALRDKCGGL
eukprot:CAMPEP_0195522896 /NCGR_PEP_ID=MMETSP0794_2-20130614/21508_1 /TAXON_ID=515487 /ORGANISM="Stephanopyxis turris, Strain CCMP 815" /LENGTH=124 /DNA_ID=CAMNT_0040652761 /DNA_START=56 /DNA_END=430 /DNA_ORIENTATION=-